MIVETAFVVWKSVIALMLWVFSFSLLSWEPGVSPTNIMEIHGICALFTWFYMFLVLSFEFSKWKSRKCHRTVWNVLWIFLDLVATSAMKSLAGLWQDDWYYVYYMHQSKFLIILVDSTVKSMNQLIPAAFHGRCGVWMSLHSTAAWASPFVMVPTSWPLIDWRTWGAEWLWMALNRDSG